MRYNINRRKFLELFGCSCCSVFTASCGTVPITERKQLTLYPESVINNHAAKAYAKLKNSKKIKLITKGKDLESVKGMPQTNGSWFYKNNISDSEGCSS